jgi:hypothetical protein
MRNRRLNAPARVSTSCILSAAMRGEFAITAVRLPECNQGGHRAGAALIHCITSPVDQNTSIHPRSFTGITIADAASTLATAQLEYWM